MFNIELLLKQYNALDIQQSIDWEKYNHYSIVHHSASIEGSTLTEEETQLLLDNDITAKGKPLEHHNMVKDHYRDLLFVLEKSRSKTLLSVSLLQKIASLVMQTTGSEHNTISGTFDSSKGDFRLLNVHAGTTRFVDFTKVPSLIDNFLLELNTKLSGVHNMSDALITSFDVHFNLVSIHPFVDGNGRVSRLLMNYVQHYFNLPLAIVFKEDKAEYYKALVDTRETKNIDIFRAFMLSEYKKMLLLEIEKVERSKTERVIQKSSKKGSGITMVF